MLDAYTASFVGLFPARAPQYVIVVKLDNPHGVHFGGKAAAPVSKVVLQAAIAAKGAAFDRTVLAARTQQTSAAPETAAADVAMLPPEPMVTLRLPLASAAPESLGGPRPVPAVAGLPLRVAVRTLHHAGFRVMLADGPAGRTTPAAGTVAAPGTLVRLAGAP